MIRALTGSTAIAAPMKEKTIPTPESASTVSDGQDDLIAEVTVGFFSIT
ncbi:hypothetical protein [Sphingobium sp. ZW T5_29]